MVKQLPDMYKFKFFGTNFEVQAWICTEKAYGQRNGQKLVKKIKKFSIIKISFSRASFQCKHWLYVIRLFAVLCMQDWARLSLAAVMLVRTRLM